MVSSAPKIAVVGAGYVGLTTALGFAELGFKVDLVENDSDRLAALRGGSMPFIEPALGELLEKHHDKNLRLFSSLDSSLEPDFIFICVGTPTSEAGDTDLSAVQAILEHAAVTFNDAILVLKSSVPPGTTEKLVNVLPFVLQRLVCNPEFLREGHCIEDFLNPDRIVIGGEFAHAVARVAELYETLSRPTVICSATEAELIKYASNAALAVRISFANEFSNLCTAMDADAIVVLNGVGLDSRIGNAMMTPGPGWGGSCLPKDTRAVLRVARSHGIDLKSVDSAVNSNRNRVRAISQIVMKHAGDQHVSHIAVWGLTFKANTDDLRESPALAVLGLIILGGFRVVAYDPAISAGDTRVDRRIEIVDSAKAACRDANLLLVLTEWNEFREIRVDGVAESFRRRLVIDTRLVLKRQDWIGHGFTFVDSFGAAVES